MADADFEVEVVYALPAAQTMVCLRVSAGATVAQALAQCGLLARYPTLDPATARVGVFGKIVALETPLCAGDRVEIYRPLLIEPKEARRRRVKLKHK